MKMLISSVTIFAACAVVTPTMAQEGLYAGAGYTHYNPDHTSGADLGGLTGRLGYRFNPNFAVEGEATVGVHDDSNAKLDSAVGVYGVGILPLSNNFEVFARAGLQNTDVNGRGAAPVSFDDTALGYGAGGELKLSPRFGVRGEYTRLAGDADTDTWAISGVVHF
jgi:outer membrane immunogenic protein